MYDLASSKNWTILIFCSGVKTIPPRNWYNSTTSNVKTSSPNMEKEEDVGQIIRKWQMFKTDTFLKRPVVLSSCEGRPA